MYHTNQLLINVAIWCLEKVTFKSETNNRLMKDHLIRVKYMRECR